MGSDLFPSSGSGIVLNKECFVSFLRNLTIAVPLALTLTVAASAAEGSGDARKILEGAGVTGGLIVHVECGDGKLTAALHAGAGYLVHGLDSDPDNIKKARTHIRSLNLYGPVSVGSWAGSQLPYENDMVNLIVVEDAASISSEEIMRVLIPDGVAYIRHDDTWKKATKPANPKMDEWSHYLHDASNNAVSSDTMVSSPRQLRWVGGPRWVRHHDHMASLMAMVSANGRLFYIFDEGNTASMQFPARWAVIARDAFNGTVLWKRRIKHWHPSVWPGKHGPARLPRRLVAQDDRVYVTLGIEAPLTALDAATGKTIRTYEGTAATEEVLFADGTLFAIVNKASVSYPDRSFPGLLHDCQSPNIKQWIGNGYPKPKRPPWVHPEMKGLQKRDVVAIDAETGRIKWRIETTPLKLTLAVSRESVFFHNGQGVVCLDREDGKQRWVSEPVTRNQQMHEAFGPTLIVKDGVILFASAENMTFGGGAKDTLTALSADTGRKLWDAPHPPSGYASPEDTFVVKGLVWTPECSSRKHAGTFTARDLKTGVVRAQFPGNDGTHMPHHRCHRAKATERFFLMSRTGIEFVDPSRKHWDRNDWVRGSCQVGVLPANGLVYAGPHSCSCYVESKLDGMCALTASRSPEVAHRTGGDGRLLKGPAYNPKPETRKPDPGDWPTYRQNQARTGGTTTRVPAKLKPLWQTKLGGRLTSPVVAEKRLFVASIDAHTVHAADLETGKEMWRFTAGGRVDSPPTVWGDLAVFGSADGCVYAVRTDDGELAWRFRAVPVDRRIVAFGQLESQWPIHGSVLIRDGVVHCVSGRSMFLDGGIRYLKLDAAAGRLLSEEVMGDCDPATGKELDANIRWPHLPVALPDILSCDGENIYMRTQVFDLQGKRLAKRTKLPHLFSPTGFQDGGAWWHRTYWVYGKVYGYGTGYKRPASSAPAGRILVMDTDNVYGFAAKPPHLYRGWSMTWYEYQLFGMKKTPESVPAPRPEAVHIVKTQVKKWVKYNWTRELDCLTRGMVLAGDKLFVAGFPRILDERKSIVSPEDPEILKAAEEQEAAWAGKRGGLLLAVDPKDGRELSCYDLECPPVWDGLIAAQGRLFMSMLNGSIVCLGAR
jgi:outer membrane protein assembly factor BamB